MSYFYVLSAWVFACLIFKYLGFEYLYWALLWPLLFVIGWIFRIFAPLACIFIVHAPRTDTVKRSNKQILTLQREKLVQRLTWFDTHDNATDEYWYGMYPLTKYFTQADYDNSKLLRWFFRVCWLWRNSAYTFNRKFFGISKSSPLAWQYQAKKPLWFGWHNDINIGWKSHKGFDGLMFAGRIIGLRKDG